jgi:hypothetical protein
MNTRTMEHRWGDRVPVDIPVQLIGPARHVATGRLTNFSVSGAWVEIDLHVPVMTNITVVIHDSKRVPMRPRAIAGYVVRHVQGGIGVGWWKLAPVTIAHVVSIHEALRSSAEPPHSRRDGRELGA